jgi:hypothetical protein
MREFFKPTNGARFRIEKDKVSNNGQATDDSYRVDFEGIGQNGQIRWYIQKDGIKGKTNICEFYLPNNASSQKQGQITHRLKEIYSPQIEKDALLFTNERTTLHLNFT